MLHNEDGESIDFLMTHREEIFGTSWSVIELIRLTESKSSRVQSWALETLNTYWKTDTTLLIKELSEHPEANVDEYLLNLLFHCTEEHQEVLTVEILTGLQEPFRRILSRVNSHRATKARVYQFFDWCLTNKTEHITVFVALLDWISAGPDRSLAVTRLLSISQHHNIKLPFSVHEHTIRREP